MAVTMASGGRAELHSLPVSSSPPRAAAAAACTTAAAAVLCEAKPASFSDLQGVSPPPPETRGFFFQQASWLVLRREHGARGFNLLVSRLEHAGWLIARIPQKQLRRFGRDPTDLALSLQTLGKIQCPKASLHYLLLCCSMPRVLQTMVRIKDPKASLDFYTRVLGMT